MLSHIVCDFLHAFKLYAADSTRAVGHEGAVVKLEKMSVLRQQLHRQLAQLKRTYMPQETAPKKGWFGRDERTFTALPLGGRSLDDDDTLEQRELLALYVT